MRLKVWPIHTEKWKGWAGVSSGLHTRYWANLRFKAQKTGAQKTGGRESPAHVDTKYMGPGKRQCSGHLGESKCFQYAKCRAATRIPTCCWMWHLWDSLDSLSPWSESQRTEESRDDTEDSWHFYRVSPKGMKQDSGISGSVGDICTKSTYFMKTFWFLHFQHLQLQGQKSDAC